MRVLHFFKTYLPDTMGGIEQVIFQLCESMHAHGVDSEVLTLSANPGSSELTVGGHRVHQAKLDLHLASTGFSFTAFGRLKALAAQADIVHYHFPWPFMDVLHFAAAIDKPYVVSYHSDIVRQKWLLHLYRPLMLRFLAKANRIVAASPNYLESSEVLTRFRDKVDVVTYGLERASYPEPDALRLQHWAERFGPRFFLFVGVMRYYKGLHVLLDAAQGTNYPIVIVGSGPLEQELHAHAKRLELNHLHFVGRLDETDKVALLTLCTAMVFPSHLRSEAFGISLLEAAMFGKPMISCEIGSGTSYINLHEKTGLVVPPADPIALREAMRSMWEHPQRTADMGLRAALRYRDLFTADRMGEQMAKLYGKVLNR